MTCMSLLLLQCLPCVLRLAGLEFGPDSVQQPLTARFIFYPACNYLMFCNGCQDLSDWKWILLKRWVSIKIWSRTQTLHCLLLFFHFPVSLVKLMSWVAIWDACNCNGLCLHLGRETWMSDKPGAVNQRAVEDNLCVAGSCTLLKLE